MLYGQSWGALLAIEYALGHQEQLRGLVLSNMMSGAPAFNTYAEDVLMPRMDPDQLAAIKQFVADGDLDNPRYRQLLADQLFVHHILRLPPDEWPDPVLRAFRHATT